MLTFTHLCSLAHVLGRCLSIHIVARDSLGFEIFRQILEPIETAGWNCNQDAIRPAASSRWFQFKGAYTYEEDVFGLN